MPAIGAYITHRCGHVVVLSEPKTKCGADGGYVGFKCNMCRERSKPSESVKIGLREWLLRSREIIALRLGRRSLVVVDEG